MKDLTPKVNNSQANDGKLTAEEFNDMRNDAQNAVTESGQTLTVDVGDDNRQLLKAIAVGGKRISRGTGETAEVGEIVLPDNSSAPVTITLPPIADLFVNATVNFEQVTDQHYSTQALTIDRNSQLIMGLSENFTLDSENSDNSIVEFVWAAGSIGWSVNLIGGVGFTVAPSVSVPANTVIPNRTPTFPSSTRSVNFEENASGTVFIAAATDPDRDTLNYFVDGIDKDSFNIVPSTGVVTFKAPPDYEDKESYTIIIKVSDGIREAAQLVTVNITDVSDTFVFYPVSNTFTFAENAIDSVFAASDYIVNADDVTLMYSLGGTHSGYFNVSALTGEVTFKIPPDYEVRNHYDLTVIATDGMDNTTLTATVNIINDANENNKVDPVFPTAQRAINFLENGTGTVFIGNATDDDDDTLTYSISGTDSGYMNVDPVTGIVTFKSPPDYETKTRYSLFLRATDTDGGFASQVVTINIIDVNDTNQRPVFFPTSVSVNFTENSTGVVFTANANDPDGDTLTYQIGVQNADDLYFNINSSTGALTFKTPPDYEVKSLYSIVLIAADENRAAFLSLTVNIIDVNETAPNNPPVFAQSTQTVSFTENRTGTVFTASASDADNDTLAYSINNSNDGSSFNINSSTGAVTFKTPPDYETKTSYVVVVTVSDGTATDTLTVRVNIIDSADDNAPEPVPPTFSVASRSVNFMENATGTVFTVLASDADGDTLIYSLSGTDASYFNINSSTGVVTFKSPPDYEAKPSYQVNASAYDGRATATQIITVNITDVVETVPNQPPVFSQQSRTISFQENATGTVILTSSFVVDPDNDTLTYTLESTDAASFNIVPSTGVVTFKTPPNYETKSSYTFRIRASDGTASAALAVRVNITDINEAPVFSPSSRTISFMENSQGTVINASSYVTDDDNNTLTFSISGTDGSSFNIVAATGVVTFKTSPDYETKNVYNLTVRATDGSISAYLSVRVNILDAQNETPANRPPSFTPTVRTVNFTEMNTGAVFISTAIDPDGDALIYTLSGTDASYFNITSSTGVVTFKTPPDYETKASYQVSVQAYDGAYTATQIITVNIIDVNEVSNHPPVFLTSTRTVNFVAEETGIVFTAAASDADNDTLTYSISNSYDGSDFNIAPSTGVVTFKIPPEYSDQTSYVIAVIASDGTATATLTVRVNIIDNDDDGPSVPFPTFDLDTRVINHTGSLTGTVVGIHATDYGHPLVYSIEGAMASNFSIDSITGVVIWAANPVVQSSYRFTARASNGVLSSTQDIVIVIVTTPGFSTSDPSEPLEPSAPPGLL